jgi:hypothetical protein
MITVVSFEKRKRESGEEFLVLIGEGSPEIVQSNNGNHYLVARRCSIPAALSEEGCKAMIGQKLPGSIEKVESEPYEYKVPSTGQVIELKHTYKYNPNSQSIEEAVFQGEGAN